ncbi:MAG: hypothetical protein Q7V62_10235, partial [Actinomycetota bacterium]|nr:hypothetical protein [Actinomycetota bacterium]
GPSADDVAAAVREVERDFADANGSAFLIDAALALRTGQPIPQPADQHAELQGVDAAAVSQVAWHARETLMVMSPEMIAVPGPPFKSDGDVETHPPVEGRTFLSPGLRASKRSLLTIGDHGLTVRSPGQEDSLTLHWSDVVAVTRERGGDYYFTGISGAWCVVNPRIFRADADAIKALIEQYLDPATLVPAPGAEHIDALEEAAVRDLKKPKDHREALDALAEEMSPGERLHRLFSAITGMKYGLLAVTDRRTLFIYGDAPTDEIPHSLTKRIDVESAKMGQTVVVDSFPEPRRYWGFDHKDEPDALRDLLRQLQDS